MDARIQITSLNNMDENGNGREKSNKTHLKWILKWMKMVGKNKIKHI
jgi:hypothetical protein